MSDHQEVACPLCQGTGHIHREDALAWEGWPTTWVSRHRRQAEREEREGEADGGQPGSPGADTP